MGFLITARLASFLLFRLDRGIWRYVSLVDLEQIIKATLLSSLTFLVLVAVAFGLDEVLVPVIVLDWASAVGLLSGTRLAIRILRERSRKLDASRTDFKRLLIVGAGEAGAHLCAQLIRSPGFRLKPVAFIDDDPGKVGNAIQGVPIAGTTKQIPRVVEEYVPQSIVIAIPSSSPSQMRYLVKICQESRLPFKILPATSDMLDGNVSITRARDVDPVDLLGRSPARLDRRVMRDLINGRRILVTGAAGSVGSELSRQIAAFEPGMLILVDHVENELFFLEDEVSSDFPNVSLAAEVVDVTNEAEVNRIMLERKPVIVFHAAAHKHVPLMERTPAEAVRNNVGGTYTVAKASGQIGVETFVLVSTDKAVKPSNIMGATKRAAELLIHNLNNEYLTQYKAVRFGNVVGSNASVVPIFKRQLARGGPITVTHPDATRYFMSLSEAAGLILQAGVIEGGGGTFVLDMGEPINILSLAETLIELSGLQKQDIRIEFTGLRAGEKLSEELTYEQESLEPTGYDKLHVLRNNKPPREILREVEKILEKLPRSTPEQVRAGLNQIVPEYRPTNYNRIHHDDSNLVDRKLGKPQN